MLCAASGRSRSSRSGAVLLRARGGQPLSWAPKPLPSVMPAGQDIGNEPMVKAVAIEEADGCRAIESALEFQRCEHQICSIGILPAVCLFHVGSSWEDNSMSPHLCPMREEECLI